MPSVSIDDLTSWSTPMTQQSNRRGTRNGPNSQHFGSGHRTEYPGNITSRGRLGEGVASRTDKSRFANSRRSTGSRRPLRNRQSLLRQQSPTGQTTRTTGRFGPTWKTNDFGRRADTRIPSSRTLKSRGSPRRFPMTNLRKVNAMWPAPESSPWYRR